MIYKKNALKGKFKYLGIDIILAVTSVVAALYIVLDYESLINRVGSPSGLDIAIGLFLLFVLLEATRRVIGPALPGIALLFCLYTFLRP